MSAHIYGFDSVNHNWEPVNVTSAGKLETDTNVSITDTINVKTTGTDSVAVTGDFYPATQPVSGSVSVSNHPTSIEVENVSGGTLAVDGSGFTQPVSGSVSVSNHPTSIEVANVSGGTLTVDGSGFTQPVSGTFFQATQPVSGSVSVSNHPTSIEVANVSGGTLAVDGSGFTQPVSGSVSVSNHPTSIEVSNVSGGTLAVDGSGFTQPVSGSVAVSSLPATAATLAAQTTGNSSLSTLAGCVNLANAVQVDIQADAVGIASQSLQNAGNASLTTLANCVDTGVNQVNIFIKDDDVGLATATNQASIETKLGELNDNAFTTETVSVATQSMDNTASLNCTNYARFEVIAISSLTSNMTQVQIQWSDDDSNWYYPDFYQTTTVNYDADGSSNSQESIKLSSVVHAKYARVRLYNPSLSSSDSVKVLMARIH